MNRFLWVTLISLCGLTACSEENYHYSTLEYRISPLHNGKQAQLQVDLTFTPDEDGLTYISYQNDAWGEENLFDCIDDLSLIGVKGEVEKIPDSNRVEIRHPKGLEQLTLRYALVQEDKDEEGVSDTYRPLVQDNYFHIFSHNLFMIPEKLKTEASTLDIELFWEDFPENYTLHNSFDCNRKYQKLDGISLEKFHSAIFVGGDFTILVTEIKGNAVSLAIRGDWVPFQKDEVLKLLTETLVAQRNFWDDHSQEYFTVTMRPVVQERGSSFQGTGLTNSFATSISNNQETSMDQLVYLFNHELMHNWIGHTIENENEEEQYWFSEGFTEYYTYKNVARFKIGGKDFPFFINGLNETLKSYFTSPVRHAPNSEITYENFWSDRSYEKLPYQRGFLFAFYLDQKIGQYSNGTLTLDDLMLLLLKEAKAGMKLSERTFLTAGVTLYPDLKQDLEQYIVKGNDIPILQLFKENGLDYNEEAELYDLGFVFTEDMKRIKSVDPASEAYRVGVREGDTVLSRSIYMGRTDKWVELGLKQNGPIRRLNYYPVKKGKVPQLLFTDKNARWFNRE